MPKRGKFVGVITRSDTGQTFRKLLGTTESVAEKRANIYRKRGWDVRIYRIGE